MADLKTQMLSLAAKVEQALGDAIQALRERDADLANAVVRGDREIDALEVRLEEECLKLLALHQPVAVDLRFIVAVVKLTSDLERIGDLAADLAERVATLAERPRVQPLASIEEMPDMVRQLLRQCLDAVVNFDADEARRVCLADDEIDELHAESYAEVGRRCRETPQHAEDLIQWLSISRYLERIADHCTNIAEDLIYLVEGQIVRHEASRRTLRLIQSGPADSNEG